MFGPMYDPPATLFGIPAAVLITGAALALMLVGLLWAWRIARGDPEPDSFWATARRGARVNAYLVAGLGLAVVAAALVVLVRS